MVNTINDRLKYVGEQDVLELKVSLSHVKPSSKIKVSWKFTPMQLSYKEMVAVVNVRDPRAKMIVLQLANAAQDTCKGYADWMKITMVTICA
jgi:hypothetical protein